MKLNLTRPLIVFDLETTGLDLSRDGIIQISYIKVELDGSEKRVNHLVKPLKPIPALVTELTSITNEMVAEAKTFKELAHELANDFKGCDFAGYNSNHFDIPMLCEEFLRAGISFDFKSVRLIDACSIFKKMEARNLAAAYKFYCHRKMEDDFQAHLADQDTEATWKVLQAQIEYYSAENQDEEDRIIPNNMDAIAEKSSSGKIVDFAGRIKLSDNGIEIFNFGKHKDRPVSEVLRCDPGYYNWILQGDFTLNTKQELTRIRLRELGK